MNIPRAFLKCMIALFAFTKAAEASFSISIVFNPASSDFTPAERQLIVETANRWTELITGYRDGVSRTMEITVSSFEEAFTPERTVFGSAAGGFRRIQSEQVADAPANLNGIYLYSPGGSLNLNVHPDAGPLNAGVILHEIGHVIGIGDLWEANEVYNDGDATAPTIIISRNPLRTDRRVLENGIPGQYVGENALREYRNEFDPAANFIPVELDNRDGSAHKHWNEPTDFAPGIENPGMETDPGDDIPSPIAISGPNVGMPFAEELMTSRRLDGSLFISRTTLGSLEDIGFTVDYAALETPVSPTEPRLEIRQVDIMSGDITIIAFMPPGNVYDLQRNSSLQGIWDQVPGFANMNGAVTGQTIRLPGFLNASSTPFHFFRLEEQ